MAHEWITAEAALRFLSDDSAPFAEQQAICERAHAGLIAAKADLLVWNGKEYPQKQIPKEFWWAEGQIALEQNWTAGDFSTWIEGKIEVKAFGVSFDFLGINELAPAERRAIGMQGISVAGNKDWISAPDLTRLLNAKRASARSGAFILEACSLGQLAARAMLAKGQAGGPSNLDPKHEWTAREWDVPLWFWRDFISGDGSRQNWSLGKASGKGRRAGRSESIELHGLHFHRSGLIALGLAESTETDKPEGLKRGRKPTYDWSAASAAIWGQIYRGELIPQTQTEIEKALQAHLTKGDKEPSESTVRPYAKLIWEEFSKA